MVIIGMFGLLETLFICPMIMPSLDPIEGVALWGAMIHRLKPNAAAILHTGGMWQVKLGQLNTYNSGTKYICPYQIAWLV